MTHRQRGKMYSVHWRFESTRDGALVTPEGHRLDRAVVVIDDVGTQQVMYRVTWPNGLWRVAVKRQDAMLLVAHDRQGVRQGPSVHAVSA